MDTINPITNPKLRELIQDMQKEQTDENLNRVLEEATMNASFLSVIKMSEHPQVDENGQAILKKDTMIQFPIIESSDGKQFYPIFTDWGEVYKWSTEEKPQAMVMQFDDYYAMLSSNETVEGLVINPFSENMVLVRNMLKLMRMQKDIIEKGVTKQVVEKTTEVKLGDPVSADGSGAYPKELEAAIIKYAKDNKDISTVWLRMMKRDDQVSYLLIAEFKGDRELTFGEIAKVTKPHIGGLYIDMIPYETDFGKSAVTQVEPIYRKKKRLLNK